MSTFSRRGNFRYGIFTEFFSGLGSKIRALRFARISMKTSLFISFYFYHSRLSISSHTQTLKRRDAQICHGTEFIADFTIHIKITNRAEKMASQGQINLISETSAFPLGMGGEDMEVNAAFRHFFNVKFRQINFYFYFHSLAFSPRK